jgi:hypothetical protein
MEDEFMNSENDNAPSSDGFQEDINFGEYIYIYTLFFISYSIQN